MSVFQNENLVRLRSRQEISVMISFTLWRMIHYCIIFYWCDHTLCYRYKLCQSVYCDQRWYTIIFVFCFYNSVIFSWFCNKLVCAPINIFCHIFVPMALVVCTMKQVSSANKYVHTLRTDKQFLLPVLIFVIKIGMENSLLHTQVFFVIWSALFCCANGSIPYFPFRYILLVYTCTIQ